MSASFDKQAIIKEYALSEGDTGSPEVQVALLTYFLLTELTTSLSTSRLTRATTTAEEDFS